MVVFAIFATICVPFAVPLAQRYWNSIRGYGYVIPIHFDVIAGASMSWGYHRYRFWSMGRGFLRKR